MLQSNLFFYCYVTSGHFFKGQKDSLCPRDVCLLPPNEGGNPALMPAWDKCHFYNVNEEHLRSMLKYCICRVVLKIHAFQNKELQDRLDYLKETQTRADVETRDVGVGCDLPLRYQTINLFRWFFPSLPTSEPKRSFCSPWCAFHKCTHLGKEGAENCVMCAPLGEAVLLLRVKMRNSYWPCIIKFNRLAAFLLARGTVVSAACKVSHFTRAV